MASPKKVGTPPKKESSPPRNKVQSRQVPIRQDSLPKKQSSPPSKVGDTVGGKLSTPLSSKKQELQETSGPLSPKEPPLKTPSPPKETLSRSDKGSPIKSIIASAKTNVSPPKEVTSPPPAAVKLRRIDSKAEENSLGNRTLRRDPSVSKDTPVKVEKLSLVANEDHKSVDHSSTNTETATSVLEQSSEAIRSEESNGVGDKIKKFEKAAEDASAGVGRLSRAESVRRSRPERRLDDTGDLPPPATPFKDNHFDLPEPPPPDTGPSVLERQQGFTKMTTNTASARWPRTDNDVEKIRPEPQRIIKPEFKPMPLPVDLTIRSPSLGAKIPDQFPSHGTAFRNVAPPQPQKFNDDVNTHNNIKACKLKNKEKYSVSKGSSYFTRGSEEIWLVKKKDIEEIEERVLDSFRRAGGNVCMREGGRPASDGGQAAMAATLGRGKRPAYARSESLDPGRPAARAHTLKRQASVACTCGHDKKGRAKSAGAEPAAPRTRSRSHGDDNSQAHVLDKYETLV